MPKTRAALAATVFGLTIALAGCSSDTVPTGGTKANEGQLRAKSAANEAAARSGQGAATPATDSGAKK